MRPGLIVNPPFLRGKKIFIILPWYAYIPNSEPTLSYFGKPVTAQLKFHQKVRDEKCVFSASIYVGKLIQTFNNLKN